MATVAVVVLVVALMAVGVAAVPLCLVALRRLLSRAAPRR